MIQKISTLFLVLNIFCSSIVLAQKKPDPESVEYQGSNSEYWQKAVLIPFYIPEFVLKSLDYVMGLGVNAIQDYYIVERTIDLLSNDERTRWILPTYRTTDGGRFGIKYIHFNQFGRGYKTNIGVEASIVGDIKIGASFENPSFFLTGVNKAGIKFGVSYLDDGKEEFFGFGPQSVSRDKAHYRIHRFKIGTQTAWKNKWRIPLSLNVGYLMANTFGPGRSNSVADLPEFPLLTGFGRRYHALKIKLNIKYDGASPPGSPTQGAIYSFSMSRLQGLSNGKLSGFESHLSARHFFRLWSPRRIFALRAQWRHSFSLIDENIPFYELPRLGRDSSLRGYHANQFTDRGFILANAEYRYLVWEFKMVRLDTIFFFDYGRVYSALDTISTLNWRYTGGIGWNFYTPRFFIMNLQLGINDKEQYSFVFRFSRSI